MNDLINLCEENKAKKMRGRSCLCGIETQILFGVEL